MAKHKIVQFIDGKARVSIVEDFKPHLESENGQDFFINPDLKAVWRVSPEFWTVKDGKIVPIEGKELEVKKKVSELASVIRNTAQEDAFTVLVKDFEDHKYDIWDNIKILQGKQKAMDEKLIATKYLLIESISLTDEKLEATTQALDLEILDLENKTKTNLNKAIEKQNRQLWIWVSCLFICILILSLIR